LISADGQEQRQLTAPPVEYIGDSDPRFSPNGHFVSFQRIHSVEVTDLYTISVADGRLQRITTDNRRIAGHTWTPDGKHLIFSSDRAGTYALWTTSASGGSPVSIGSTLNGFFPTVSRTNSRLIYSELTLDDDIWNAKLSRDPRPQRIISSTLRDLNGQYSPDGKHIAFASDRTGSFEIWVCDPDGQNARSLTSLNGPHTGSPRWSPDGHWLAFDSRPSGNADIYVISSEGGPVKRLRQILRKMSFPVGPAMAIESTSPRTDLASLKCGKWRPRAVERNRLRMGADSRQKNLLTVLRFTTRRAGRVRNCGEFLLLGVLRWLYPFSPRIGAFGHHHVGASYS
jgi:Tol biopolymer transport system component